MNHDVFKDLFSSNDDSFLFQTGNQRFLRKWQQWGDTGLLENKDCIWVHHLICVCSDYFFFFISSSFASFFRFRKASRSSKVWAPGMILEGLARGETLLLLFPPTASITLFITVSIPLNSSLTATETSVACIKSNKGPNLELNRDPLGPIQ